MSYGCLNRGAANRWSWSWSGSIVIRRAVAVSAAAIAWGMVAHAPRADDFTWNGGDGTWPSLNWTNVTTSATPVGGPTGASNANSATISAGTVTFAGNDTFGSAGTTASPAVTLDAGGTLNSGGFFNTIWDLNLTGGTLLADGGVNTTYQAFQLAGTVAVTGSQASTIGVAASPRNALNAISLGGTGNTTLTLNVNDVTSSGDADLMVDTVLKNGPSWAGSLTKTGTGTLTLSAANTFTGANSIAAGTLALSGSGTLGDGSAALDLSGGRLDLGGTSQSAAAVTISAPAATGETISAGTLTGASYAVSNNAGNVAIVAALGGVGLLTKTGAGTLTLSGASTFSGGTTVSAGTLALSGGSNRLSTAGAITVAAGATLDLGGNSQATSGTVTLASGSTISNGVLTATSGLLGGNNALVGTLTAAGGGGLSTNQRLLIANGGTGSLTLTGAGSFAFGGDAGGEMNYVGVGGGNGSLSVTNGMTVNFTNVSGGNGYVNVGSNSSASVGSLVVSGGTVNVGTWLKLGGFFNSDAGSNATASLSIDNGTVAIGSGDAVGTFSGVLQMNGFGGDATTSGTTSLTLGGGGVLEAKQIQIGYGTKTITFDGGTLRAAAASTDFLNDTAGLSVEVGNGGGTVDTNGFDVAISAPLAANGSGGLTKAGTGTLTLSGASGFTGGTTVSAGTLAVTGGLTGTSGVAIAAAARLGGSGTIATALSGAGLVSPGNSPGILTAAQVDPTGGLDYAFEFTATGSPTYGNAAASVNDVLRLTDATTPFVASLSSGNVIDVYFDVATLTNGDTFKGGFYTDLAGDFSGSIADAAYAYWVTGNGSGTDTTFNGQGYYSLSSFDSSLSVLLSTVAETADFGGGPVSGQVTQFVVVPEPGTLVLGGMVAAALAARGRRRPA